MSIDRTRSTGANTPIPGAPAQVPQAGTAAPGVGMQGDAMRMSGRRRSMPGQRVEFSWSRALGHFFNGFKNEGLDMVKGLIQHPLKSAAMIGLTVGAVMLAPLVIPVSAAALGTALAVGFVGLGVAKAAGGAVAAVRDHLAGNNLKAEQDFEQIGRGGFDVASVVVPAGIAKGASLLARTEAGAAVLDAARASAPGRAVGGAVEAVESLPGKLVGEQRMAAFEARLASFGEAVAENPTLKAVRSNETVGQVAGKFNQVFDNPTINEAIATREQALVDRIDASKTGQAVTAWAKGRVPRPPAAPVAAAAPAAAVSDVTGIEGKATMKYTDIRTPDDLDTMMPGFRDKVLADLKQRGVTGYTADDIVIGRKRLFQANVITEDQYASYGIKQVMVDGKPKLAVPTIDSPKPLLYDTDAKIIQKVLTNPDTGELILKNGQPQLLEVYGVPAKKFNGLYAPSEGGRVIATDKRVVAIPALKDDNLLTPWDPMQVKPGDALMYPVDQAGGNYVLGAPYRHEGGELLKNAYTLGDK